MMINRTFHQPGGHDRVVTGAALIAGLISQSLGFFLFSLILLIGSVYSVKAFAKWRTTTTITLSIAAILAVSIGIALLGNSRLAGIGNASGDYSIFVRIFGPAYILPDYLFKYPLGHPSTTLLDALNYYTSQYSIDPSEYTMNQLWNFEFYYGFVGIFMAYFLLRGRDMMFSSYLFLTFFFNGTTLGPDKFFIIIFVAIVHQYRKAPVLARPRVPGRQLGMPS